MAQGLRPTPSRSVAQWAQEKRYVSDESGSPHPGKWNNARSPLLIPIMEAVSFSDPAREIGLIKSHQVGGSELIINLCGSVIEDHPCSVLVVLASHDDAGVFERTKLQPTIDASPSLKHRVREQRSRSEKGSTSAFKRFRGGFLRLTSAQTAKGLKGSSIRVLAGDEITEWPLDVDNQGDPLTIAEKRTTAYSKVGYKRVYVSTPGTAGSCRMTAKWEASDQRRFYVPCPHCGAYQYLTWDQMAWKSDTAPHGAYMVCKANGCIIEEHDRHKLIATEDPDTGELDLHFKVIKTYTDDDPDNPAPAQVILPEHIARWEARPSNGRQPFFHLWQAYSDFVYWDDTVAAYLAANDNGDLQDFVRQVLGEAFEEAGDAPDYEKLAENIEDFPLGTVPPQGLSLTGFADVQGNRLEWAVYAWGRGLEGWLVDKGIIEGDPEEEDVWAKLAAVTERQYYGITGHPFAIEAFGVDAGYCSNQVYRFVRGHERRFAMDGRDGWTRPLLGTPTTQDVTYRGKKLKGGVQLWPSGTFPLKSKIYAGLRKWMGGPDKETGAFKPGTLHFGQGVDEAYFQQLTAEYIKEVERSRGIVERQWHKLNNRPNEALDIAVGCRALAYWLGLDFLTPERWDELAAERGPDHQAMTADQAEMARLWGPAPGRSTTRSSKSTGADTPNGAPRSLSEALGRLNNR